MTFIFRMCVSFSVVLLPSLAFAYIGPGAGLSAIGTIFAFVGSILLLLVGFLWYPAKRLLIRKNTKESNDDEGSNESKGCASDSSNIAS